MRRQLWPGLHQAILCLLLLGVVGVVAQQPLTSPLPVAGDDADLEARTRHVLPATYAGLDVGAMLAYYSRTSPDIHAEIRTHVAGDADDAATYLGRLAEHYLRLDRVRERNPAEFERLMSLDLIESRARMLGRLILQFSDAKAEDSSGAGAAMARAKDELRGVLERAFDSTQQNQRIELNRLEAELRTMRRLLDERASKRDLIIRQRFLQLCGQEMPPPSSAPGAESKVPPP